MPRHGWFQVLSVMVLAALVASTGCKKKEAALEPGADRNVGGVEESLFDVDPLPPRPAGFEEYRGDFPPVFFGYDSSRIEPAQRAKLEEVADHLRRNPDQQLIIEGHCDERGSREYNLALGERRALAARAYLIGLGIDGGRLQTKSLGEEQPAEMGHNESAWAKNRRAEFILIQ